MDPILKADSGSKRNPLTSSQIKGKNAPTSWIETFLPLFVKAKIAILLINLKGERVKSPKNEKIPMVFPPKSPDSYILILKAILCVPSHKRVLR